MADVTYMITVDEAHVDAVDALAKLVSDHGLTVNRVVKGAGAIQATGSDTDRGKLESIEGVMEVRPEGVIRHPPMNPKIPQ